ncbi:MAG: hypothetical protein Q9164_003199 [Protoblastenia rupestris]
MSKEYEGQDPLVIAEQAERDLNSHQAKHGISTSDSARESGVDTSVTSKFPGSEVKYGSAASGAGDNREIPIDEGGEEKGSGRSTKARDFEGAGGPETKQQLYNEANPGNDDVESNVRQTKKPTGDTVPTDFGGKVVGKDM